MDCAHKAIGLEPAFQRCIWDPVGHWGWEILLTGWMDVLFL